MENQPLKTRTLEEIRAEQEQLIKSMAGSPTSEQLKEFDKLHKEEEALEAQAGDLEREFVQPVQGGQNKFTESHKANEEQDRIYNGEIESSRGNDEE